MAPLGYVHVSVFRVYHPLHLGPWVLIGALAMFAATVAVLAVIALVMLRRR